MIKPLRSTPLTLITMHVSFGRNDLSVGSDFAGVVVDTMNLIGKLINSTAARIANDRSLVPRNRSTLGQISVWSLRLLIKIL